MLPAVGLTPVLSAITTHNGNDYESVVMHCVKKKKHSSEGSASHFHQVAS